MNKIITSISLLVVILLSCSKEQEPDIPVILSEQNLITSFKLTINNEIINGEIDQTAKTIYFSVAGAELNSLMPTVDYSDKARLSPSETTPQNFNNEVPYTVYAENGDPNVYRVIIDNRPLSSENKILSFSVTVNNETINADINDDEKLITFNVGSFDKTQLNPTITVSEYASISPQSDALQNFDNTIVYTVIAENGDIREYNVIANAPRINGFSTIAGVFTMNPTLLYTRADISIYGNFIDPDRPNATLYLFDGTNKYLLPILKSEKYNSDVYIDEFVLYTKIPDNVLTSSVYKIIYEVDDFITVSDSYADIVAENAPRAVSLNQDSYYRNDVLIITGENLPDMIAIPSNGSLFLIESSYNYDFTVNAERTEIRLTLDYYYLFPSYFARDPQEKVITLLGPGRRAGETITALFN